MKNLTKLVDFSHDPAIVREAVVINDVFSISNSRANELLVVCENAYKQHKERGEEIFDTAAVFLKLVEADAFTPQELAFYAALGFAATYVTKKGMASMLQDLGNADPEIKRRLPFAMMKASIRMMGQEP